MSDCCENFNVKELPISDQQAKKIKMDMEMVMTFSADERPKVAEFFVLLAEDQESMDMVAHLYSTFMSKIEENFPTLGDLPSDYLALLQSSSPVLLSINIIFIKTAYNGIHREHAGVLKKSLNLSLESCPEIVTALLSAMFHINNLTGTRNRQSSSASSRQVDTVLSPARQVFSFQGNNINAEVMALLQDLYMKFPKDVLAYLKTMFLYLIEMEYCPGSRGVFLCPTALHWALNMSPAQRTQTTTNCKDRSSSQESKFYTQLCAVCGEALSELTLLFTSHKDQSLDIVNLLSAVSSICCLQNMSNLTITTESLLFSKLPAKARIAVIKHVGKFLPSKPAGVQDCVIVSSVASKAVMVLLDVAMLDPVKSLRREALNALLSSDNDTNDRRHDSTAILRVGGKDLIRVAVFKCRDKCAETRRLGCDLLERAMDHAFHQNSFSQDHEILTPAEMIAVTRQLLQVDKNSTCSDE